MQDIVIDDVRELLDDRRCEVDRHLSFVKALIDSKSNRIAHVNGELTVFSDYEIDRALIKTISATGYLLIYNLLESTMTAALDLVHRQLKQEGLRYEQLNEDLRKICLKNFKEAISDKSMEELRGISVDVASVWLGYDSRRLWNGNVDVKKIREKASGYGIRYLYDGDDHDDIRRNVLNIKEKRNALAHGRLSFEQCGQDTAIDALIGYSAQVYRYLTAVLNGIDCYLIEKAYLKSDGKSS